MITAELRYVYSTDIDVDAYVSSDPSDDGQWIRLIVGPRGGPGEESLDVLVCTSLWLTREIENSGPRLIRHTVVMPAFNLQAAVELLRREVSMAHGATWDEVAIKLVQIGFWEFDDYRFESQ